jgi:hypothetical protein
LSPSIAEKVYSMHIRTLWDTMISSGEAIQRTLFEPYIRFLLTRSTNALSLVTKILGSDDSYQQSFPICKTIKLLSKVTEKELQDPLVLLHFLNPTYPLIDCIYKDIAGTIFAIQITTGETHSMDAKQICKLHKAVGLENKLNLYYFVPSANYSRFKTTRSGGKVNPNFEAYIVSVPNPDNDEVEDGSKERQAEDVENQNTNVAQLESREVSGTKKTSGNKRKRKNKK